MKKILIVDDENGLREILVDRFTQAGWQVTSAQDGEEALDMLAKDHFDFMLLDLLMPKKDGFEVMEELNRNPALDHPVILILTVSVSGADVKRALSMGAVDYFTKSQDSVEKIIEWANAYKPADGK